MGKILLDNCEDTAFKIILRAEYDLTKNNRA